jgi:hypothetical protein
MAADRCSEEELDSHRAAEETNERASAEAAHQQAALHTAL